MNVYDYIQELTKKKATDDVVISFTTKEGEELQVKGVTISGYGNQVFIECTE